MVSEAKKYFEGYSERQRNLVKKSFRICEKASMMRTRLKIRGKYYLSFNQKLTKI